MFGGGGGNRRDADRMRETSCETRTSLASGCSDKGSSVPPSPRSFRPVPPRSTASWQLHGNRPARPHSCVLDRWCLYRRYSGLPDRSGQTGMDPPSADHARFVVEEGARTDKPRFVASALVPHTVLSYQTAAGARYTPPRRGERGCGAVQLLGPPGAEGAGPVARGGAEHLVGFRAMSNHTPPPSPNSGQGIHAMRNRLER